MEKSKEKGDVLSKTIDTKYLGETTITGEEIINFSAGLPGFSEEVSFALLDLPGNPTFKILQSLQTKDLAFIVVDPYQFYSDYTFTLDEQILENLQITEEKDVAVLTIVTLKEPFATSTLNLKAPIIVHTGHKQGKQYILNQSNYSTKSPVLSPQITQVKGD